MRDVRFHKDELVSEKVGGAEGTKLDEDFKDMERKVDVTSKAVADVLTKTTEYLQPNPVLDFPKRSPWNYTMTKEQLLVQEEKAFREYLEKIYSTFDPVKLSYFEHNLETWRQLWRVLEMSDIVLLITDIRHPVIHFSPALYDYVTREMKRNIILVLNKIDLAPPSLVAAWKHYFEQKFPQLHILCFTSYPQEKPGETDPSAVFQKRRRRRRVKTMAVGPKQLLKACENITQGKDLCIARINPLHLFTASRAKLTMLNTVSKIRGQHHLKKLEGRRLDYDYKKKRQGKIPEEEIRQAMEKFDESKDVAETSMYNLLETDIEQVSQMSALVEAQLDYHRQAVQILEELSDKLKERIRDASGRPKREYQPKPRSTYTEYGESDHSNGGFSFSGSTKSQPHLDQPCCKALYDFEPENEGELGFKEGDTITLTNQIDDNWYEGMLHGQSGFFPVNYVEVLVPLPQ
ncbi:hypothetical protein scyTo_0004480, partial [Scyliorhinus torazame]|nr:hypothetical protein [Scyliorhinus torazame]